MAFERFFGPPLVELFFGGPKVASSLCRSGYNSVVFLNVLMVSAGLTKGGKDDWFYFVNMRSDWEVFISGAYGTLR